MAAEKTRGRWLRAGRWLSMGVALAVGVLLITPLVAAYGAFWGHLGTALIIAAFLGFTIDFWLKQQIAKDVFEASIGYLLPDEFREEMRFLYNQDAICEEHTQSVTITPSGDGKVRFVCNLVRRVRNVSGRDIDVHLGFGCDEWCENTPSVILSFGYRIEGQLRVDLPDSSLRLRALANDRPIVEVEATKVSLPPNKSVTYWVDFVEIKPLNSDHHAHFTYATRNPTVRIAYGNNIDGVAAFPRETDANKDRISQSEYRYAGLIYPGQEIRIRWWERDKLARWLAPTQ